jgi:hypothetical protein
VKAICVWGARKIKLFFSFTLAGKYQWTPKISLLLTLSIADLAMSFRLLTKGAAGKKSENVKFKFFVFN